MQGNGINLPTTGYPANTAASNGSLVGNYSASVNMFRVQYTHSF
jgi:hypothetical protein